MKKEAKTKSFMLMLFFFYSHCWLAVQAMIHHLKPLQPIMGSPNRAQTK